MQFRSYRSLLFKFWTLCSFELALSLPLGDLGVSLPLGDLGATYGDHLRLSGKRVGDFLLVLIELFFVTSYGWGAKSDYWFKAGDFAPTGAGWPNISCRRGRPHQPFFFSQNYSEWSFARYKNLDWFFFRFVTIHRFDGRTDGQTEISSLDRVCIQCSAVKISMHK